MNIYFLHSDMQINAQYHTNSHVNKMRTEYAQLACFAHHVLKSNIHIPYKLNKKHINHPSTIWVREAIENYMYVVEMGLILCEEMRHRFGTKFQKTEQVLRYLKENPPKGIPEKRTPIRLAIGKKRYVTNSEMYTNLEYSILNYRGYYFFEKAHLHKWKNRDVPEFIEEYTKNQLDMLLN